jgi:hypothetical protein
MLIQREEILIRGFLEMDLICCHASTARGKAKQGTAKIALGSCACQGFRTIQDEAINKRTHAREWWESGRFCPSMKRAATTGEQILRKGSAD